MRKPEVTSAKVATIAGRILAEMKQAKALQRHEVCLCDVSHFPICTVKELRTLAASCLTQTPDKKR